jgi:hypothetical protein
VCFRVGVCLRHKHHATSYHRIILHTITSYIISHQQQSCEGGTNALTKIFLMKHGTMCSSTKHAFGGYNFSHQEKSSSTTILYNSYGIEGVTLSLRSMKGREGVFSPKAKKWYARKFHASHYINIHTDIQCLTHI